MMADTGSSVLVEKEFPKSEKKKTSYDVIIIGAGPAGYTAGIYCSRAKYDTLILSGILPGGQLVNTTEVENYPGFENGIMGPDLMMIIRKQTERMGTTIIDDEVVNVDFRHKPFKILTASEEYECRAVIIATGASPRKLGLEGEMTFGGRGVSYCATCDGPFFRNQELAVVGGGDSAIEEATFLTKFASKVHLVHRRDTLKASKIMQERAFANSKIQFHWDSEVVEIIGEQKVNGVTIKNLKNNQKTSLPVGGIFVAIGHTPNTKIFEKQVELDSQGYVVLKNHTRTSVEGVFAAGDVHDHRYRQAITAAGFGCMAAIDVDRYLTENK
ncbi:thioredoxin-disulfide reductase [Candidatus Nitrosotenuis uzonensis]|uniref:Thioredoxin reductase, FAD/NAD(P)-binding n=1 Tax=Candidatus Nitrosotenuis uzonensis TaxID=1407055 RepID=A0A812F3W7_9ARCH|nr:thioredoxin-disulfide reductase [Candidatus Nitrosotenuis uzonensis]MCA2003325.1 thioredoxin-disulfide reductase [Candidatus Nitrosotenuis sp.]CAE6501283.1 thioredoxin reductase, FAD/NAD(P)-binding [Candidatus Nitrosotenuis uzonensis]